MYYLYYLSRQSRRYNSSDLEFAAIRLGCESPNAVKT